MDAMQGVVAEPGGTAHAAMSKEVTIGGKTGTAQVIGLGKGKGKKYMDHAWFVAVAPMDNQKIAVCVLVEHSGHGGSAAAPLAKKVIEAYMRVDEESLAEKNKLNNVTGMAAKALPNRTGAKPVKKAMRNITAAAKKRVMSNVTSHAKKAGMRPAKKTKMLNKKTEGR